MPLEREIKLRFDSADEARAKILALGATPLHGRRLQEDCLLDTEDEQLRRQRRRSASASEGGKSLLTFKGPVQPGRMKIREEHETVVADGAALLTILEALGLHVWFRYEKYREEFSADDVVIAIDETPVGVFVEIEGGEDAHQRHGARRSASTAVGLHHRFVPVPVPAASRRERPRRARHGVRRPTADAR